MYEGVSMVRYLLLEKGSPYPTGFKIPLNKAVILLGRSANAHQPDISFDNPFISRSHCSVAVSEAAVEITDLASKHGTEVNNSPLEPSLPVTLKPQDYISLAHGAAILRLCMLNSIADETLEIGTAAFPAAPITPIRLDPHKRRCLLGTQAIALSPKEWSLLSLLHNRHSKMVSLSEIKSTVWPERQNSPGQIPSVGAEEINLLIYRLRQKLGSTGSRIKSIRGSGCMLE